MDEKIYLPLTELVALLRGQEIHRRTLPAGRFAISRDPGEPIRPRKQPAPKGGIFGGRKGR